MDKSPEQGATISAPHSDLRQKLGPDVDFKKIFTDEKIESCEQEIGKVQDKFLDHARERVDKMQEAFLQPKWGKDVVKTLTSHSFTLKGQAESLGYQLMALTAWSLNEYCEKHPLGNEHTRLIVQKHLNTMQVILKDRIKGDGGALGQELLSNLKLLIAKYHPEDKRK